VWRTLVLAALPPLAGILAGCGDYGLTCLLSGDPDCAQVAKIGSTAANGTRNVLGVARADCAKMNITPDIIRELLQTCWIVTLDDPEKSVREVVIFRDGKGEFHSTLCLSPNCDS
jgi:hypothetical protein